MIYFKQRLLVQYSILLLNPNLNICLNAPNTVFKFANLSSLTSITLPQFVFECFCLNAYKSIIFSFSYILNLIDVIHTLYITYMSVIPSFPHVSNLDWCWNTSKIILKSVKFLSLSLLSFFPSEQHQWSWIGCRKKLHNLLITNFLLLLMLEA